MNQTSNIAFNLTSDPGGEVGVATSIARSIVLIKGAKIITQEIG